MRRDRAALVLAAALVMLVVPGRARAQLTAQAANPAQAPAPAPEPAPASAPGASPAQESAPATSPTPEESPHTRIGGLYLQGWAEAGVRFFLQKPSATQDGKFLEYRDINTGLFLPGLQLRLFTPDEKYSFEVSGRDWGLKTMEYEMTLSRLGQWEAGFEWDQMRHIYSTDAKMLATEPQTGIFTLPTPRPPLITYNSAPTLDEVAVQWNTARMFFKWSPSPDSDVFAQYTRVRKEGNIPMGMAFGSPGNNFLEVLQPIDQTIHEFKLSGSWVKEKWQLQFAYTLSVFENDLAFMRADNPCASATNPPAPAGSLAPCSSGDQSGPQFGTTSLPPNNLANTFNLSGGINLPYRTRVNASLSYSFWLQNQDFLPQTFTNSLPATNASVALPQQSLHGNVQNILFNITATSRPLPIPVTFTAKYRYYNMIDLSDTPTFPAFIVNDANSITVNPTKAVRFDYMRQGATIDARYKIVESLALTTGIGWDQWKRSDSREVPLTNDMSAKAALDWTPADWALIRATYSPSFRRMDRYCTICLAGQENSAEPGEPGQSYLLRKFDEADRNQQAADLMVQLMPTDNLTITPVLNYTNQQYIASGLFANSSYQGPAEGNVMLGVQQVTSWSAGIDANWKLTDRIVLGAGYVYESRWEKMRSRNRTSSVDVPALDWISSITDTTQTVHFSALAGLIPSVLDLKLAVNYSYTLGSVDTRNPNATNSAVFTANPNAQAFPFPSYTDGLLVIGGSLRYHFWKNWTASLNYAYEQWRKTNWQTDTLDPFQPGVSSIWLGNNPQNYTAQIVSMTLGYTFR